MSGTGSTPRSSQGRAIASSPWIVVFAGVVAMLVLMVVALGTYRGRGPTVEVPPGPHVALPLVPPSGTAEPDASATGAAPVATSQPSSTASARPSPSSAGPSASSPVSTTSSPTPSAAPTLTLRAPTAPVAPPSVRGQYDVEQRFSGGFIGEVKVSNVSGSRQPWTVELDFSGKRIVAAWVTNAGQGTLRRGGDDAYTYHSGDDLAPGTSVRLLFHVDSSSTTPTRCVVNGTGCSGL